MRFGARLIACLCLFGLSLPAMAETAYVTDRLLLGLYEEPGGGKPFKTFESGTEVEVLQRRGNYAQVRGPEGAEGWVKAAYLVDEEPARAAAPKLQAKVAQLRNELIELRQELERRGEALREQERAAETATKELGQAREEVERLRRENERMHQAVGHGINLPVSILVVLVVGLLAVGVVAGMAWLDQRHRRRHGGFRV